MRSIDYLPEGLNIRKASFYRFGGTPDNIEIGARSGHELAVFDYSNNNADALERWDVVAIRMPEPLSAKT